MRILSRLPDDRGTAPYLSQVARRRRDPDRVEGGARAGTDRPIQLDERPIGIGPARGIAIAVGTGALCWAALLSQLIRV